MLFRSFFDLFSIFFSMFCLSILCLFHIFAFLCFVVLCFVIEPNTKLYGVLTKIYDDDDEVYDLPVISLCSLFGFVSLHGLRIVTVKMCSFTFAIIVFVRRLNLYVVFIEFCV